jgi:hypothetical protein
MHVVATSAPACFEHPRSSWWRLFGAVDSPAAQVPGISLCGGHLLGDRVVGFVVSDVVESLAVELGEPDAVGLVRDEEIENGPDEREAAVLAREAAHHLRAPFDFAE